MKSLGFSAGYQYPHDFEGHHVAEEYLPDELRGRRYYQPSSSGAEAAVKQRLDAILAKKKPPF
jgi:putative ATPase